MPWRKSRFFLAVVGIISNFFEAILQAIFSRILLTFTFVQNSSKIEGMKKHLFWFFVFPLLNVLTACPTPGQPPFFRMPFGKLYDASVGTGADSLPLHTENISYAELSKKVEHKENFLLLVYDYSSLLKGIPNDCTCWSGFATGFDQYLQKYDALVYGVNPSDFPSGSDSFGLRFVDGEVTLAAFADGYLQYQTTNGNDSLSNLKKIEDALNDKVFWGKFRYVTKQQVEEKFAKKDEFALGFLRKTCSDCAYLSYHFLKECGLGIPGKIYLLECDTEGIRYQNGIYNPEQWQTFKDEYGLSNVYNTTYGYDKGYVPTFIMYRPKGNETRKANAVYDMAVYLNDTLEQDGDTVKITKSYWDGTRKHHFTVSSPNLEMNLLGRVIPEGDWDKSGDTIVWKRDKAADVEDFFLRGFFDYYGIQEKAS